MATSSKIDSYWKAPCSYPLELLHQLIHIRFCNRSRPSRTAAISSGLDSRQRSIAGATWRHDAEVQLATSPFDCYGSHHWSRQRVGSGNEPALDGFPAVSRGALRDGPETTYS